MAAKAILRCARLALALCDRCLALANGDQPKLSKFCWRDQLVRHETTEGLRCIYVVEKAKAAMSECATHQLTLCAHPAALL